jgi:plasmid maintenance system antidote protein VapI
MYHTDVIELQKMMIEKGFRTIKDLADAAHVNRDTISHVIAREKNPSTRVIYALSEALGLDSEKVGKIFFARKIA